MVDIIRAIDLSEFVEGERFLRLSGEYRGRGARERFELDALDAAGHPVDVYIPENVYSVSVSFFIGMFGPSYRQLEGEQGFSAVYRFHYRDGLLPQIRQGIERCAAYRSAA